MYGTTPADDAAASSPRRLLAPVGSALGAAGLAASLTGVYIAMRDVMASGGGFCARGGPYVIGSECTSGQVNLLLIGFLGLFVFWAVHAGFTAWSGGPVLGSALVVWGAIFGALGWNFIEFGVIDPPQGEGVVAGWLVPGVIFWIMAAFGLIPAAAMGIRWIRRRGEPETSLFREPLVRAAVPAATELASGEARHAESAPVPRRLVLPSKPGARKAEDVSNGPETSGDVGEADDE